MIEARPYHHGNLRRTLLDAAVAQIRTAGPASLNLRGLARERLAPAKRPKDYVRLDALPRTASGKVRRLLLTTQPAPASLPGSRASGTAAG